MSKTKFKKIIKWICLILLVALIGAGIAFKIYTSKYYRADEATINVIKEKYKDTVRSYSDNKGEVFLPVDKDIRAVIVFYPGGKVEYTAYEGLMYELADRGIVCLLPKMPENLAFFRLNAVESIQKGYEEETALADGVDWYLAGHSLGGAAAAKYLSKNVDSDKNYKGLILCASYSVDDLSDTDYRLLSIYGSNDRVLNMISYRLNKRNWPKDATEIVFGGGIHSYFGCYGIQNGDGKPGLTNLEQIERTAEYISNWID
ncbi:alpha/beta hydrolase [Butyrivibrio proteoclasticus]|uniref:alpha/beta hydrolase n=1 Tax=Butyrivibrio proteoclasticus TaxID=43305 RepID=UPI00047880F5|nr:alpha/beta hydrolase [Butyrivibrio proteoclasticus]